MAAASTPKKLKPSSPNPKPYSPPIPPTPALRRSTRRTSSVDDLQTPQKPAPDPIQSIRGIERTPDSTKNGKTPARGSKNTAADYPFSPVSPDITEKRKRKRSLEAKLPSPNRSSPGSKSADLVQRNKKKRESKKRVYYKKVVFDGGEFEAGDDVYVKRREDASSDEEDPEVEECWICFKSGKALMIECDDCLGGFHLKCVRPSLKEVPEGDWVCEFCHARRKGKRVELPAPPKGKNRRRTSRDKLLSSDLWAAHIESLWKDPDGTYWFRGRWYLIPEETSVGRQPHNLRRELYRTNDFDDIEMESVLRHCYVMNPKEFSEANNEGDDVFLCEYEYDVHRHSFKRLADIDNEENGGEDGSDEDWDFTQDPKSDSEGDIEYEEENRTGLLTGQSAIDKSQCHKLAANSRKGRVFGLQRIGTKKIPEHVRCHKKTELEKAKATLLLAILPKSLPCRNREMEEIAAFVKGAISDDRCLGHCLYIHGVPGTGKTMSVLAVMRNIRSEVDAGSIRPFSFVEINGLKLASPENIYREKVGSCD